MKYTREKVYVKRGAAWALAFCMVFGMMPMNTPAVEKTGQRNTGLPCHPEHDEDCGYREILTMSGCTHKHDEACGYEAGTKGSPCTFIFDEDEATPSETHKHNEACGYEEAVPGTPCSHEHDDACGYKETITVTSPCTHQCELCMGTNDNIDNNINNNIGNNPPPIIIQDQEHIITITEFLSLDEAVKNQTVPAGTEEAKLNLPAALWARGYTGEDETEKEVKVTGVIWEAEEAYDENAEEGIWTFDPVLPAGYEAASGVELPQIRIAVEKTEVSKAEQVMAMIDALPELETLFANPPGEGDPDYDEWLTGMKEIASAVTSAKNQYDGLSEEEKSAVGDERRAKLWQLYEFIQRQPLTKAADGDYWSNDGIRADSFAAGSGDGSSKDSPYLISNGAELGYMAYLIEDDWKKAKADRQYSPVYPSRYYRLTGDIDLDGHDWKPIGNGSGAFKGTFDGGGFTVENMNIIVDGGDGNDRSAGLFGDIYGGMVKNLTIGEGSAVDVTYTGSTAPKGYGAVAGDVSGSGTVENCHSFADISVSFTNDMLYAYTGGIVGYLEKGTVKNCSNSGTIGGTSITAGGIAGANGNTGAGTIRNCWNRGTITVAETYSYAGGITGYNIHENSKVENSYNIGNITGRDEMSYYGGVIGANNGTVENCYNAGALTLPDSRRMSAGGLVGDNRDYGNGKAVNCYWLRDSGFNDKLSAVGASNNETDLLSFGRDGAFSEGKAVIIDGTAYSSLLPALSAWVDIKTGEYWFWTGDRAAPELTEERPPETYAVTVGVKKDDREWTDHGKTFRLVNGDISVSNLNAVEDGTYNLYEGNTDTGVIVTVNGGAANAELNYYTVTFYDGDTAYDTGSAAPQIILKNSKAAKPADNPVKENHIFDKWVTSKDGADEFDFGNTSINEPTGIYAKWTFDTSTEVKIELKVSREGPYYVEDSLLLTAEIINKNTHVPVTSGKVQFYAGDRELGDPVNYNVGPSQSGFYLTTACGTSNFMPFLTVGENSVKAVYTPADGGTEVESEAITITVQRQKNGNRFLGTVKAETAYNGSEEGSCPVQFVIANNGEDELIYASQLTISGWRGEERITNPEDFTVSYNEKETIAYVHVKKPGTYTFTATLTGNADYVAEKTAAAAVAPAKLTITPENVTIVKNETPSFSYKAENLKGNDNITGVTYKTTANGNYENVGTYIISIESVAVENQDCYEIETGTGRLTITSIPAPLYTLNVDGSGSTGSSGSGSYRAGAQVEINAGMRSGYSFNNWTSDNGGSFGDVNSSSTTFTMPAGNTKVTALWTRNSSGGGGSNSSSSSTSTVSTVTSTSGTEDGGQVITGVTTDAKTGQTVTTVVKKDGAGNVTEARAEAGTSGITTNVTDGQAQIQTFVNGSLVTEAVNAAGSPIPVDVSIGLPGGEIASQFANTEAQNVSVTIVIPDSVTGSDKINVDNITLDKAVIEAAKEAGKDLTVAIKDEKGNVDYVWMFNGQELQASAAPATEVNLAISIIPVRNLTEEKHAIKAAVADRDAELKGLNLSFGHSGDLPSKVRVRIPSGNEAGINHGDTVYLYYYNPTEGKLEALPENRYKVEADGFVTILLTHCSDYVLLPEKTDTAQTDQAQAGQDREEKTEQNGTVSYTIKRGDTLNKISRQYGCSVQQLLNLNPGLEIYDLRVGSNIIIPV
ncbi:LysM peptidoglycan-binding domain-containing protein [Clostridium sp. AM58-1XD]|uniref:InlB B-repeat-containing protein n=1 Tax=Clostridium sp. AM58-1XD TaxID=2292307 RepID=UPI000E52C95B|nr:LysM peptidoglycan-binding domain-containing protein [Clostridium sp. AM58-1XD]RGY96000.1 LysM peptidoglycan-binding domain-containing protein [Clostridium sp. AM58-1XD]